MKRLALCLMLTASSAALASPQGDRLIAASRDGLEQEVAALIAAHAPVNATDDTGGSALAWAVIRDNQAVVARLLKAHADPNLADANGVTPLMLAVDNNQPGIVQQLLAAGGDARAARPSGETLLMSAVRIGSPEMVRALLARHVDVNAHDAKYHQTALMWAAGKPQITRLLLEAGADAKAASKSWETMTTNYSPVVSTIGNTGIPWLFDNEYRAAAGGVTALIFAAQKGDLESVKLLLAAGADVNQAAADGTTPLLAALYKFTPNRELQDVNQRGIFGGLNFHPDLAMANFLLDHGAKAIASDRAGYTPLHAAVMSLLKFNRIGVIVVGFDNSGDASRLPDPRAPKQPAGTEDATALVTRLLAMGADPNAATTDTTPGPLGAVKINPAPPGSTPYHLAAASGNAALVELLAARGGDANKLRKDGHTPFTIAVMSNNLPVVQALAAHGADLAMIYNPSDKIPDPVKSIAEIRKNETILHIAAIHGADRVIPFLAAQGVKLDAKNDRGETALDLADSQERFRYAIKVQALGNVDKKADGVVRETKTSDVLKTLTGKKPKLAAN
jgi:ankyrin repeat protein